MRQKVVAEQCSQGQVVFQDFFLVIVYAGSLKIFLMKCITKGMDAVPAVQVVPHHSHVLPRCLFLHFYQEHAL